MALEIPQGTHAKLLQTDRMQRTKSKGQLDQKAGDLGLCDGVDYIAGMVEVKVAGSAGQGI